MRKLVLSMFLSVDGFLEGPGGEFIGPEWSADLDAWTHAMIDRFDTMLFGRAAWQFMAGYWPQAETAAGTSKAQRKVARYMNGTRKIVFSRTLAEADAWSNSEVAARPLAEEVAAEKARPGRDMVIYAGAKFAGTAIRAGLIDEYSLLTVPMLFGGGARLFDGDGTRRALDLIESRALDTGAVLSRYDAVR